MQSNSGVQAMVNRRRRRAGAAVSAGLASALLLGVFTAAPASAYSSPDQVPNPFQDYSAQDYADALWNLETSTYVRTHERASHGDCDVQTYTVEHPLESEPTNTYAQVVSPDGNWCAGSDGDELREELDEREDDDEHFIHGRPYENTAQREPYYGTWADVTGNAVSSRTEIHARDAGNSSFTVAGTYFDHYSGEDITIGETETHAEHMIPVGHTWPDMQHRDRDARVAYYNDPMNLTSTQGEINREKDGQLPSEWMPENDEAHCAYGLSWVHIANKHRISLYSSDIDALRELMWDCLEQQLPHDGGSMPQGRSADLSWTSAAPAVNDDVAEESGSGPRGDFSTQDYADAVWNLENHVRIRSVERESGDDCAVETYTIQHPRGGETTTYSRVISAENTFCSGDEGDELRAELDDQAEDGEHFRHGQPMDGQSREYFGYWTVGEGEDLNTRHRVLARDLDSLGWNSTETSVLSGEYSDPYTGSEVSFTPTGTEVDHIVPVQHAWIDMEPRDEAARTSFYNDVDNLLAVPEESAQDRGAAAPRNWMPEDEDFHCRYALAWTHIAAKHEVSLFSSDIEELRGSLYGCLADQTGEDVSLDGPRRSELQWPGLPLQ